MRRVVRGRAFYLAVTRRACDPSKLSSREVIGSSNSKGSIQRDLNFLKAAFRTALKAASRAKRLVFLEVFSGSGGLSAAIRRRGCAALSLDIRLGRECDITKKHVLSLIEGWLSGGCVAGLWLGTPCSSWSRARRGPPGSNWCCIRSREFPNGMPNLRPADVARIALGNATMLASARLIRAARRSKTPCFLENPSGSLLWDSPPIAKQVREGGAVKTTFDFCQYGKPWRKRTVVMGWGVLPNPDLGRVCCGRRGLCSRTGAPHIQLSGTCAANGQLWTRVAEPYPSSLCARLADHLIASMIVGGLGGPESVGFGW